LDRVPTLPLLRIRNKPQECTTLRGSYFLWRLLRRKLQRDHLGHIIRYPRH
jgi:hypothetical protein